MFKMRRILHLLTLIISARPPQHTMSEPGVDYHVKEHLWLVKIKVKRIYGGSPGLSCREEHFKVSWYQHIMSHTPPNL